MEYQFNTVEEALEELRAGHLILTIDDPDRENEGDLICAAQFATTENVNFMATHAKGLICTPMSEQVALRLGLEQMVKVNTDNHHTAFTVSIDHVDTTTGISAEERGFTCRKCADIHTKPEELRRPGHVFPLVARRGGVLTRNGHTEATVDLCRLAGLEQCGLCCEIMRDDGTMMRTPELMEKAKEWGLKIITIKDLQDYCRRHDKHVVREACAKMPTRFGEFRIYGYVNDLTGEHHVALVKGEIGDGKNLLCRVHSECLTGDVFGSRRCDCGQQLAAAMQQIPLLGNLFKVVTVREYQVDEERNSANVKVPQVEVAATDENADSDTVEQAKVSADAINFDINEETNKLIEEFMLLANRTVAEFIGKPRDGKKPKAFVYRVQDLPDPDKMASFAAFITRFGYKIKTEGSKADLSKGINSLLANVQGKPEENLVETIAIRAMAKAVYTTVNIGHYGLSFDYYTHFTSPIRRYPDLMVHRLLERYMAGGRSVNVQSLEDECKHASDMEQLAANAERASIKYKQVEFMGERLGEEYDGVISGITEWGLYVEINENKCEGLVPIRDLEDDYYEFDEKNYCLMGRRKHRIYRLGDPIRIKVARANLERKQLDFALVE